MPDMRMYGILWAQSLNGRFGTSFTAGNILMTVECNQWTECDFLKTLLNPGDQVITLHRISWNMVDMYAIMMESWW